MAPFVLLVLQPIKGECGLVSRGGAYNLQLISTTPRKVVWFMRLGVAHLCINVLLLHVLYIDLQLSKVFARSLPLTTVAQCHSIVEVNKWIISTIMPIMYQTSYSNRAVSTCLVKWLVHMTAERFRGPPSVSVLLYVGTPDHSSIHNKWEGLTS